jgi:hypothetical protein
LDGHQHGLHNPASVPCANRRRRRVDVGVERAMFEKPQNPGAHMKPLFIQGHLDGMPVEHMLMDGGASVNILLLSLFKKLGDIEDDLKCTNPMQ